MIKDFAEHFEKIPKEILLACIYELMVRDKISYHELSDLHIRNLERMRKGETEAYFRLQSKVIDMWVDKKKNLRENLKRTIQLLKDEGRINITQEKIDNYK